MSWQMPPCSPSSMASSPWKERRAGSLILESMLLHFQVRFLSPATCQDPLLSNSALHLAINLPCVRKRAEEDFHSGGP